MRLGFLKTLTRFAFCALVAAMLFVPGTSAPGSIKVAQGGNTGQGARSIEGTWQADTMILNCQNGVVLESFSKLVAFNMGGTLGETSSSSLFRSAAFGIWEHTGVDSFRYAQRFFRFNPDGTRAGSVRATWSVSIEPATHTYTAEGAIQIVAPNGIVVAELCGVEMAERLAFED